MQRQDPEADPRPFVRDVELLALWAQAHALAQRWCRRTFARLACGEGGFYDDEDLLQDLFLEFWSLLRAWRASGEEGGTEALWAAWRRRLWGGGRRVLQRRPQDLWRRRQLPRPPDTFALDDPRDRPTERLQGSARATMTQRSPAERLEELEALDALDARIWALHPTQRQVLYLLGLRGMPAEEIAQRLNLEGPRAVYSRAFRARLALRRRSRGTPRRR